MPIQKGKMTQDLAKLREHWKNQEKAGQLKRGGSGARDDFFYMREDGDYTVRILEMYPFQVGSHWGVLEGVSGKKGAPIRCPRLFNGSDCPICEKIEELQEEGSKENKQLAERLTARPKFAILLADLDEEPAKPRLYEAPMSVYFPLLELGTKGKGNKNFDFGNFMDPEEGRDVCITRKTSGKKTNYEVTVSPNVSPFDEKFKDIPDADKIFEPRSYADIKFALENGAWPQGDEAEEEALKARKSSLKYKKGLPASKTKDEDLEDEEEQEEEEAPKRINRKARKPEPVEEDLDEEIEEQDAEEDEEAEESPPSKAAISVKDRLAKIRGGR